MIGMCVVDVCGAISIWLPQINTLPTQRKKKIRIAIPFTPDIIHTFCLKKREKKEKARTKISYHFSVCLSISLSLSLLHFSINTLSYISFSFIISPLLTYFHYWLPFFFSNYPFLAFLYLFISLSLSLLSLSLTSLSLSLSLSHTHFSF